MKDGISLYPKGYLLLLISNILSTVSQINTAIVDADLGSFDVIREINNLLDDENFLINWGAAVKVLSDLHEDPDEAAAISAELSLHHETFANFYKKADNDIANQEITEMLKKVGINTPNDESKGLHPSS